LCLYINNKQPQKKKLTISFTKASKRIKNFGINLTKELKDLRTEDHNTMLKKVKENTNGKISSLQVLGDLILRCPYYPKQLTEST